MHITELFDPALLARMLSEGYVRAQVHPAEPLKILNYTERAQFDREWNDVTRTCRGLIVRTDTGEIVARPFPKFHNHDEPGAPVFGLDERVEVYDKLDGSLGILYPLPDGGHAVATRGSFASEQAVHATAVWNDRYADRFRPSPSMTYLFEIIYPANRIVVDYGSLDDLVLLGGVDDRGYSWGAEHAELFSDWPGPRAQVFHYETFAEALAAEPRAGLEGYVVRRVDSEDRVKIKYADYVKLHRIVTGLNARTVWEHMLTGRPVEELIEPLPDEFHGWVRAVRKDLADQRWQIMCEAVGAHNAITAQLGDPNPPRKDYAMVAKDHPLRAYLFRLYDGRDIDEQALKAVKPGADWTPTGVQHGEDAA